jgi:hypothetical protein
VIRRVTVCYFVWTQINLRSRNIYGLVCYGRSFSRKPTPPTDRRDPSLGRPARTTEFTHTYPATLPHSAQPVRKESAERLRPSSAAPCDRTCFLRHGNQRQDQAHLQRRESLVRCHARPVARKFKTACLLREGA